MQPSIATLRIIANSDRSLFEQLILKEGLRVVGLHHNDPLEKTIQAESIVAMASTIMEDACDSLELTPRQQALKEMAEQIGYLIAIDEGLDQHPGTEIDPLLMKLRHPDEEEDEPTEQAPEEQTTEQQPLPGQQPPGQPPGQQPPPQEPPTQ